MKLVGKKEFVVATFDLENKIFIVHIASLMRFDNVYLSCKAQTPLLKADEALITVFPEYLDFADNFSLKLAVELQEYTGTNNHTINLVGGK